MSDEPMMGPEPYLNYTLSAATEAALDRLVEEEVLHEYQVGNPHARASALQLARERVAADGYEAFVARNPGYENRVWSWAQVEVNALVKARLVERECQCRRLRYPVLPAFHGHGMYICHRHYEADVPELDGLLLCGTCYVVEWDARQKAIGEQPGQG
jgi:hypothetical protein